jgi:flagellar biosynthesis/type III secretory pathway M-ring protein FliF/YscJ
VAQTQLICVAVAIVVLLCLSFVFGWRQLVVLRRLREGPELPAEESRQQRRQARRRLVGCVLLALLAFLLAGAQLFLEERVDIWIAQHAGPAPDGEPVEPTPEQRNFFRLYGVYWIILLVVLLAVVALAGIDLWETRRRGLRERRKLLDDQRVMLQRQMTRWRRERDGPN